MERVNVLTFPRVEYNDWLPKEKRGDFTTTGLNFFSFFFTWIREADISTQAIAAVKLILPFEMGSFWFKVYPPKIEKK